MVVTVTAADGETTQEYTVILDVLYSTDTSLATFTVNGEPVDDGVSVDLDPYTTDVEVVAEATDAEATVEISGDTDLVDGENTLTVTVTAADGETTQEYNVILNVLLSTDTSLATFTVNGDDVEDGSTVELEPYTTDVEVVAEATDSNATVEISGDADLLTGENILTVTVTAADGETVQEYTVTLNVLASTDTTLATFTVNGDDVDDGASIDLEPYTTEVEVVAEATDSNATVDISGDMELFPGENTLVVTVTAADGETVQTYNVTLNVLFSTDTSLATFTVNGETVDDGSSVDLDAGTTSVEVATEATDAEASIEVSGDTDLVAGENTLTVTVTAADGETVQTYTVTLNVAFNTDASLAVFTVDGQVVEDGSSVDLAYGTTYVDVTAEATDPDASVEVSGDIELVPGENFLVVTVTAADGETQVVYTVTLNVLLNSDVSLATFTVNGETVDDGSSVNLAYGTSSVEVIALATDPDATVEVAGNEDLQTGENTLTVTVTAADGETTMVYTVILIVAASGDSSITGISVDGVDIAPGDIVNVAADVTSVEVAVTTRDENATVSISGADDVRLGDNRVTVTVTAANGTSTDYVFVVRVGGLSADATLTSLSVNREQIEPNGTLYLPARTTSVSVEAVTRDRGATVKVSGRTNLQTGSNTVVVTVTAADLQTTKTYYVYVVVAAISSNKALSTFTVNGQPVQDKGTFALPAFTRAVNVVAIPEDVEAVAVVTGRSGLVDGDNTLTVRVTAADGSYKDYTVNLAVRILSGDTSLRTFTFNGMSPEDGVVTLQAGAKQVGVVAIATSPEADVVITGDTELRVGANTVTVRVKALNGNTKTYRVIVQVPESDNTNLKTFQINGRDVQPSGKVTLPLGSFDASVKVATEDPRAKFTIRGYSGLTAGDNELEVTVIAADNTTVKKYVVNLFVTRPSSDKTLKIFRINGSAVSDGSTVVVPALTGSVLVEAAAYDAEAKVEVSGKNGLTEGSNQVTALVTAGDGTSTTYRVTVKVLSLSSDNSLKTFTVKGEDYTDQNVELPFGTTSVDVVAIPTDATAKVSINGAASLRTGLNNLSVKVTAANGAPRVYPITVTVKKSSNKAVSVLTVNGQNALNVDSVTLPVGTSQAVVQVVTSDSAASYQVSGTAVSSGSNTLTVTVTAADGSSRKYEISVYVTPLSSNTSLASLKLKDNDKESAVAFESGTFNVSNDTSSVIVSAIPADAAATVVVSGNSGFKVGNNTVTIVVTAANGDKKPYTVKVVRAKSANTALSALVINGVDAIAAGYSVTLPARTTSAVVKAAASDAGATVSVAGTSLSPGANTVAVTVTAADGTPRLQNVSVYVTPLSSNTSLYELRVDDSAVAFEGATVNVGNSTTSVPVTATAEAAAFGATVAVSGNTGLRLGNNTVSVVVTAANGDKKPYTVTVVRAKSSNNDLSGLFVNGVDAKAAEYAITLPARTTTAVVKAVTADAGATISVAGTSLSPGPNTVAVTVTAADGTPRLQNVSVYVTPLSSDTSLKTFTVNGEQAQSEIQLPIGTTTVAVVAIANDAGAKVEITGNTGLSAGPKTVRVRVTAANGDVKDYEFTANVAARSANTDLSSTAGTWLINGIDVSSPETVVVLPAGTTAVTATAKTADSKATLAITGTSGLTAGTNTIAFKVTAEDGSTTRTYERSVTVKALSSDVHLNFLSVADISVNDGSVVNVPAGTSRVSVVATPRSSEARYTVAGNTSLSTGAQNVVVVVTAPSGATSTWTVSVVVAAPASNTNLSTFTINNQNVTNGSSISVARGTTQLHISAIAADTKASVAITGKSGLRAGANTVTVTVTALSGDSRTYTVTVNVGN